MKQLHVKGFERWLLFCLAKGLPVIMFSRSIQMAVHIPKLFEDTWDHPWREEEFSSLWTVYALLKWRGDERCQMIMTVLKALNPPNILKGEKHELFDRCLVCLLCLSEGEYSPDCYNLRCLLFLCMPFFPMVYHCKSWYISSVGNSPAYSDFVDLKCQ